MRGEMEEREMISEKEHERRQFETLLRLVPVALCVSALVVMIKTHQSNSYDTLDYSNVGGFRYLAYANGICAALSLISAFSSAIYWSRKYNLFTAWVVFFLDQILTYMMLAAGAVASELVYLAEEGDEKVTWVEICSSFGRFCNRAMASVVITFVAVLSFIVLSLISSYRLFSKYDPPNANAGHEGRTIAFA